MSSHPLFTTAALLHAAASLAFGLSVMTMAYTIGHISGCHLNPNVNAGSVVGRRHPKSDLIPYIVTQVIGGIEGAAVLYLIASGKAGFSTADGFASNGFGEHSPSGLLNGRALIT